MFPAIIADIAKMAAHFLHALRTARMRPTPAVMADDAAPVPAPAPALEGASGGADAGVTRQAV